MPHQTTWWGGGGKLKEKAGLGRLGSDLRHAICERETHFSVPFSAITSFTSSRYWQEKIIQSRQKEKPSYKFSVQGHSRRALSLLFKILLLYSLAFNFQLFVRHKCTFT